MASSHQPFHQKYRPKNLDELVGQSIISLTLKQALKTNRIAPAYLFCGPRGTGKTSSARIFAKSLNCLVHDAPNSQPCNTCDICKSISNGNALDIIEIDAASNTGVENIRDLIERANFAPTQTRWKVYVIDECHMLSTAASNALLKTIEEPPDNVVFILATTNPEKVIKTIQSRCHKFDFKRINSEQIYKHLLDIAAKESIKFEDEGIKLIAKRSNGGMRDAQSLLDQLSLLPEGVTKSNAAQILGEVSEYDLVELIYSLIDNDSESLLRNCSKLYDLGNEPIAILEGLLNITRDLLLKTVQNNYSDLFYTSKDFHCELNKISESIENKDIINWHKNLKNLEYQIKNSNQPRLWLEINLTSLLETKNQTHEDLDISHDKNLVKKEYINLSHNDDKKQNKSTKKISIPFAKNESNAEAQKINDESQKSIPTTHELNISDNESINLKEKWSLILAKLELPSTRMLLSQQAQLLSINSNYIEIGLAPNWENMIKSRKIVIETAVKKIYGEHMSINFVNNNIQKENINSNAQKTTIQKDNPSQNKNINNNHESNSSAESNQSTFTKNSSKNLADFFNGEIVDLND